MSTTGGEPKYSSRGGWATTARVVRHDPMTTFDIPVTRLQPTPPPVLLNPPRPGGDLSTATADEILAAAESLWVQTNHLRLRLRAGIPALLSELEQAPGDTWQQRWQSRGLNDGTLVPADLVTGKNPRGQMTTSTGSCSACG